MPTASDIRAWAREQGMTMTARGNIPGDVRAAYDAAHPHPNGTADPGGPSGPDYPDDDFETAFGEPPEDEGFDESVMNETRPRNPRSPARSKTTPRGGGGGLFRRRTTPKGGKEKRKRVSTEDVLGSLWRAAAKLATPLPPLQRTLRIQAPVAGLILEDTVKNTAMDTVLQPFARMAGQGKVVSALVGPPLIVTALSVHAAQRQAAGLEPNPFFVTAGVEALRSSLMSWMEVAGPKFMIALKREREFEDKYGQSVDELIAFLLSPPAATEAEAAAEEEAIRRAQGIMTDA